MSFWLGIYLGLGLIISFLVWIQRDDIDLVEFIAISVIWPYFTCLYLTDLGSIKEMLMNNKLLFIKLYALASAILFLVMWFLGWWL